MQRYEYKVIPAPEKGLKAKGVKAPADRFALAVETSMNELGVDGWEYWRAECLPASERAGLTGSKVTERHMLVFRRPLAEIAATAPQPVVAAEPPMKPQPEPMTEPAPEPLPESEPEAVEPRRAPVFTRKLQMAREQRAENLERAASEAQQETDATFVRRIDRE